MINAFLIHNGREMVQEYYASPDQKRRLQPLHSVTKSILSLLLGIVVDRLGESVLELPVKDFASPKWWSENFLRNSLRVKHLLAQRSGLKWSEENKPFGPGNSNYEWEHGNEAWIKALHAMPLTHAPGEVFTYNSGVSHWLGYIISCLVNENLDSFAQRELFLPLEISEYYWMKDPQGLALGGRGLKLRTADMLKMAMLLENRGLWGKRRLISEEWIAKSTQHREEPSKRAVYAGHWWRKNGVVWASGFAGQFLFWHPRNHWTGAVSSQYPMEYSAYPWQLFLESARTGKEVDLVLLQGP